MHYEIRFRNLIKLLHWDGTGLLGSCQKTSAGNFRWPRPADSSNGKISLEPAALAMLWSGQNGVLRMIGIRQMSGFLSRIFGIGHSGVRLMNGILQLSGTLLLLLSLAIAGPAASRDTRITIMLVVFIIFFFGFSYLVLKRLIRPSG